MAENNNVTSSKICRPCRPELWQTEDPTETPKDRALCRKATKIALCLDGTFLVDRYYCDIWGCERCGPRQRKQICKLIEQNCRGWYNVLGYVDEVDYVDVETIIERSDTRWVSAGTTNIGWIFLTERPVIDVIQDDIEETLYRIDNVLTWPSMSKERRLRYSKGLFPEHTKIVEAKDYILVEETHQWVREILRRQGYTNSWKRKRTRNPNSPMAWDAEIDANMVEDILKNKWFTVLKKEGV